MKEKRRKISGGEVGSGLEAREGKAAIGLGTAEIR